MKKGFWEKLADDWFPDDFEECSVSNIVLNIFNIICYTVIGTALFVSLVGNLFLAGVFFELIYL